jgi:hypothetical protein
LLKSFPRYGGSCILEGTAQLPNPRKSSTLSERLGTKDNGKDEDRLGTTSEHNTQKQGNVGVSVGRSGVGNMSFDRLELIHAEEDEAAVDGGRLRVGLDDKLSHS